VAGSQAIIEVRQLHHLDEFPDVVRLQQVIWGFEDVELLPLRFLVVVSKVGGHVFGAYDAARDPQNAMVGFCFAIPGIKPGARPYLHSHMLGVLPEYRDAGVGRRLKLRQREEAVGRGIDLIEWTFDPLELKNAFFNIERLGAIVRRYSENTYGVTGSPLHGGLPTDRCTAEWWIDSPRVRAVIAAEGREQLVEQIRGHGIEVSGEDRPVNGAERISYPADIGKIRREDPARARQIQQANAALFQDAFRRGLAVTHVERSAHEGTYVLEPWK
jgi:predicted GNAT superfamily acetyltransferase